MPAPGPPLIQPRAAAGHPLLRAAPPTAASTAAAALLAPTAVSKPVFLKPAVASKVPTTQAPGWDKRRVQQRLAESGAIPLSYLRTIFFA